MNPNFLDTLLRWSRRNGASPAVLALSERRPLSWADLPSTVSALADAISATGIQRTSRVAIMLPAGPEAVIVFLAVMRAGIAVPLNPELTAAELKVSLARLRPHLVIYRNGLHSDAGSVAASLALPAVQLDWRPDDAVGSPCIVSSTRSRSLEDGDPLASPQGTRLILQTSGTTAMPKLVPLTAGNLEASARALITSLSLTGADRGLNLLPQYHVGGLWDLVAGPLLSGGSVICGGMFSMAAFRSGCLLNPTWVQLAPAMLQTVIEQSAGPLQGMRFIRSVSAALPPAIRISAEAVLEVPIVEIYGMTESAGVITSNPLDGARQRTGSVGVSAGTEITIRDQAGIPQPTGTEGEVYVRGDQVSAGYIDAPLADSCSFGALGFKTGDLGKLDEHGNLWLLGRSKDLINRGGEMISPAEVEHALLSLPGVVDAAVFGLPDSRLGEEIAAAIITADPAARSNSPAEVRSMLRPILGHSRLPSRIFLVDAIPRTVGGKLQRHKLVELFTSGDHASMPLTPAPSSSSEQSWPEAVLPRWVAEIWAPILDLGVMGPGEDFFAKGGCSIKAAQATAVIQEQFPGEILYVSSVYEAPTPLLQAAFLERHYPVIAARVLGRAMLPDGNSVAPVTPGMMEEFRSVLADPLRIFLPPARRCRRAIFILGAPRSGSTLLRAMLAGHSMLFAPPELYLLSHPNLAERHAWYTRAHASQLEGLPRAWMAATGRTARKAIADVAAFEAQALEMPEAYRLIQEAIGARLLVDKTPYYGVHQNVLVAADAVFEDAFFIHLSRHPYGMIRSFEEAKLAQLWWPRLVGGADMPCPFHPRQLAEMIWECIHSNAGAFLRKHDAGSSIHVRYEQLVEHPEETCRAIAAAMGLPFEPGMLDPLGDPASRMTDGLMPGSRMIGDPKFHTHASIERAGADRWKHHYHRDFLSERTWTLATALGHGTRVEDEAIREVFDV